MFIYLKLKFYRNSGNEQWGQQWGQLAKHESIVNFFTLKLWGLTKINLSKINMCVQKINQLTQLIIIWASTISKTRGVIMKPHQKWVRPSKTAGTIIREISVNYKAMILCYTILIMIKEAEAITIELGTINVSRNFFEVEKQLIKTIQDNNLDVLIVQDLQNSRRQLKSKRVQNAREMRPEGNNHSFYRRNKQGTIKYGARLDRWIISRVDLEGS